MSAAKPKQAASSHDFHLASSIRSRSSRQRKGWEHNLWCSSLVYKKGFTYFPRSNEHISDYKCLQSRAIDCRLFHRRNNSFQLDKVIEERNSMKNWFSFHLFFLFSLFGDWTWCLLNFKEGEKLCPSQIRERFSLFDYRNMFRCLVFSTKEPGRESWKV